MTVMSEERDIDEKRTKAREGGKEGNGKGDGMTVKR